MLGAVQLYGDACVLAEKIDLQSPKGFERDWQLGIQEETARRLGKGLEAVIEEGFGSASSPFNALGIGRYDTSDADEQRRERIIDAVAN
jgi:hypothetical protein